MSLISKISSYLDTLKYDVNPEKLRNREYFFDTYLKLRTDYEELISIRRKIEFLGYQNPYFVIKGVKDAQDPYFRKRAMEKKICFDNVQHAIAAHRVAIGQLIDAMGFEKDGIVYTGHEAIKFIEDGGEGKFIFSPDGVYRLDILKYLSFSGEYMKKLFSLTKEGRENYRKIMEMLGDKSKSKPSLKKRIPQEHGMFGHKDYSPFKKEIPQYKRDLYDETVDLGRPPIYDKNIRKVLSIAYAPFGVDTICEDIALFYLKKTYMERKIYGGPFPTIDPDPNEALLGRFYKTVILKEDMMNTLKDMNLKEKNNLVAAISYYLVSEDYEKTLTFFSLDSGELESALIRAENYGIIPKENKHLLEKIVKSGENKEIFTGTKGGS
jgi:Zn-finger domain-containing protein